ncbi:MAG: cytochrome c biogenesis protein CcsA, partial [Anaerolineales bacterium]|nr:cytochrome c biogenesis protein CcsA [Anaerolineales bacterium]
MLANIGFFALVLALGCAVYAVVLALLSAAQRNDVWLASARRAAFLTWPLLTAAALLLIALLVTDQYQVHYVTNSTSRAMPLYLKVTALWGGQEGSLVFWAWLMSTFTGSVMLRRWERDRSMMPYVIAVTNITLGFFIALVLFIENPFSRLWHTPDGQVLTAMLQPAGALPLIPTDGRGLNPLLRHPGMIIHPPMLYLGFVGFVIPYAFAI